MSEKTARFIRRDDATEGVTLPNRPADSWAEFFKFGDELKAEIPEDFMSHRRVKTSFVERDLFDDEQ